MLYALSVGCTRRETKYVYENDEEFAALPTFGVLALHAGHVLTATDFGKLVPNYNPVSFHTLFEKLDNGLFVRLKKDGLQVSTACAQWNTS